MSYDTFDDGYKGIQLKCLEQWFRWYDKGDYVPLYEGFLPKNCIIATNWYDKMEIKSSSFTDEVNRGQGYVFLLFRNSKYINCFFHLKDIEKFLSYNTSKKFSDIKGKFPIYEDEPFNDKPLKENWILLNHNYFIEKKKSIMKIKREKPLNANIFEILKEKDYFK